MSSSTLSTKRLVTMAVVAVMALLQLLPQQQQQQLSVSAFQPVTIASSTLSLKSKFIPTTTTTTNTALYVFGSKKSKKMTDEEMEKYWQGEWVCKDCGYIYNRAECAGMFFEEQGPGFRCPQCSGPRRRYAKKVGDRVGTTLDGGDAPILIFSFGGVIATIIFGIWAVNNL